MVRAAFLVQLAPHTNSQILKEIFTLTEQLISILYEMLSSILAAVRSATVISNKTSGMTRDWEYSCNAILGLFKQFSSSHHKQLSIYFSLVKLLFVQWINAICRKILIHVANKWFKKAVELQFRVQYFCSCWIVFLRMRYLAMHSFKPVRQYIICIFLKAWAIAQKITSWSDPTSAQCYRECQNS